MDKKIAYKVYQKTISAYNKIAYLFARTRKLSPIWKDLKIIKDYYQKGKKVLDLGCGSGDLIRLIKFEKDDYWGIDASPKLIKLAQLQYPGYRFEVKDYLNFENKRPFDIIYWIAGIHHIPSKELRGEMVKKIYTLLKNKGYLIITSRNIWRRPFYRYLGDNILAKLKGQSQLDWLDAYLPQIKQGEVVAYFYYHFFTQRSLAKLLQQAGFNILQAKKTKRNYIMVAKK